MPKKPNVILITVDALRPDHLSFMGYGKKTSPNIDQLAQESTVFTKAFSVGPNSPHSFPAILTSTYPLDYQGLRKIERPRLLLSEALKEQGYITAAFHSTPYLSDFFGYNRGWDYFEYIFSPFGQGLIPDKGKAVQLKIYFEDVLKRLFKRVAVAIYPEVLFKLMYSRYRKRAEEGSHESKAGIINRTIKDFISSVKTEEKPFFFWVHYMDVHSPYFPRKDQKPGELLSFAEFVSAWLPGYLEYAKHKAFRMFVKPYFEMMLDFYDQGIRELDKDLADLFSFLKAEGVYNDTVICFTADHGEEFLEHGEGFHNSKLYNELLQVPLLIKIPGRESGQVNKKVSLIDLPSTICELVGINPPQSFKGKSFFNNTKDMIFHESGLGAKGSLNGWVEIKRLEECKFACQSESWKYILDYRHKKEELFDLVRDPREQNNLLAKEPAVLSRMRQAIENFKQENPPLSLIKNI